jgi:hypothetical protein
MLWLTSTRWTPAHTAALITGAWPAHSLLSLFVMPLGTADRAALVLIMLGGNMIDELALRLVHGELPVGS